MNPILITGTRIVIIALIFYTIGLTKEIKKKSLSKSILIYFSIGLFFDITATALMIIGSPNSPFTLHGFIGYSALLAMTIEVFVLWRLYLKNVSPVAIPGNIHKYTVFAYIWWILAFFTGGLLVVLKYKS